MRHIFVLATLVLTLAFSALAEDVQVPNNLDSGSLKSFPVMSEEVVGQMMFAPAPPRKTVTPAGTGDIVATVSVQAIGPTNEFAIYHSYLNVPSGLPEGSTVQSYITKPGGDREPIPDKFLDITPELAGRAFHGELWFKSLPSNYPAGLVKFSTVIVTDGVTREFFTQASFKMVPIPVLGPLTSAHRNSDGSIFLEGDFRISPVVVASNFLGNRRVPVNGRFISAQVKLEGQVKIVLCDEISLHLWECSTQVLPLPLRSEGESRNR